MVVIINTTTKNKWDRQTSPLVNGSTKVTTMACPSIIEHTNLSNEEAIILDFLITSIIKAGLKPKPNKFYTIPPLRNIEIETGIKPKLIRSILWTLHKEKIIKLIPYYDMEYEYIRVLFAIRQNKQNKIKTP